MMALQVIDLETTSADEFRRYGAAEVHHAVVVERKPWKRGRLIHPQARNRPAEGPLLGLERLQQEILIFHVADARQLGCNRVAKQL